MIAGCIDQCCNDNGVPKNCIHEELKTASMFLLNDTHPDVTITLRNECIQYRQTLMRCKDMCLGLKKGKIVIY